MQDFRRVVGLTIAFVLIGAIVGAVTAALSLLPLWLGLTPLPRDFANAWVIGFIAVVGVPFGAVFMPILGWLIIDRLTFWRAVFALTFAAVVGENLAALLLRSLNADVLVLGALLGVFTGVLIIRLRRRQRSTLVRVETPH